MTPVDNTAENAERCVCPACPSYSECMRTAGDLLYCAREKSACVVGTSGCSCGSCSVWRTYALNGKYFCMVGAATH